MQTTQLRETWQAMEPGLVGMLELPDWEFKTPMINTLRDQKTKQSTCKKGWVM